MTNKELSSLSEELMNTMIFSDGEKKLVELGGTITGVDSGVLSTQDQNVAKEAAELGLQVTQIGSLQIIEIKP